MGIVMAGSTLLTTIEQTWQVAYYQISYQLKSTKLKFEKLYRFQFGNFFILNPVDRNSSHSLFDPFERCVTECDHFLIENIVLVCSA